MTQESTGSRVFVYFITRLPRVEGGTSYVGFHGGKATTTSDFELVLSHCLKNNPRLVNVCRPLEISSH